jgi:ABC-type uncharacterized transport system auxiliary subunit
MTRASRARFALASLALVVAGASGCALTSKSELVAVRYFTPEHDKPRLTSAGAGERPSRARAPARALALGAVTSGSNLRERIAYRDGAHEIGYYEDQRWTERPETYVRRELGRTLFEERGFERTVEGGAPELDVEVLAFDELRLANGARAARVQLKLLLWQGQDVLVEETLTVDRPVAARQPRIEDFVAAMAAALDDAAEQVAQRVAQALAAPASHGTNSPLQPPPYDPRTRPPTNERPKSASPAAMSLTVGARLE